MKPITDIDDPRYVKALAHPLRIRILAMLADRSASPVQLSGKLDATLGTVAYHVRTLHSLGLVELVDTRHQALATMKINGVRGWASLLSTHPPLEQRIAALQNQR